VATDFDGTLTPIVRRPGLAVLGSRARAALAALVALPRARVAVISGRRLDDLRHHIGMRRLFLAGTGGLESQDERGRRTLHLPPGCEIPGVVREALEAWCAKFRGAWLEDKGVAVALHYRALPARRAPGFRAGVRRIAARAPGRTRLLQGKQVVEVMPAFAWDKAAAVRYWHQHHGRGGLLFYFGDDTNDEPAHQLVRRRRGISVGVGRRTTRAEYALDSELQVVWFLEWLAREWRARSGFPRRRARR
jgi:trehalose-phosphatase